VDKVGRKIDVFAEVVLIGIGVERSISGKVAASWW
jgi:hypothetical protein